MSSSSGMRSQSRSSRLACSTCSSVAFAPIQSARNMTLISGRTKANADPNNLRSLKSQMAA